MSEIAQGRFSISDGSPGISWLLPELRVAVVGLDAVAVLDAAAEPDARSGVPDAAEAPPAEEANEAQISPPVVLAAAARPVAFPAWAKPARLAWQKIRPACSAAAASHFASEVIPASEVIAACEAIQACEAIPE